MKNRAKARLLAVLLSAATAFSSALTGMAAEDHLPDIPPAAIQQTEGAIDADTSDDLLSVEALTQETDVSALPSQEPDSTEISSQEAGIGELGEAGADEPTGEILPIAEDAVVVGSDGIRYEGVTYLSYEAAASMSEDLLKTYIRLCDDVAAELSRKDSLLTDVVFYLTSEGELGYTAAIAPINPLETMAELSDSTLEPDSARAADSDDATTPDTDNSTTPDTDNSTTPDTDNSTIPYADNTIALDTDNSTSPDADNSTSPDTDNIVTDDTAPVADTNQDTTAPIVPGTDSDSDGLVDIIPATNVTPSDEEDVVEENPEALEIITTYTEEPDRLNTYFTSNSRYYRNQPAITENSRKVYDAIVDQVFRGGAYIATATLPGNTYSSTQLFRESVAAITLDYSYALDFHDGTYTLNYTYSGGDPKITIGFNRSPHYSNALEQSARAKINELVRDARAYVNDPKNPKRAADPYYYLIEYFDDWLARNCYYESTWGTGGGESLYPEYYYYCHSSYGVLLGPKRTGKYNYGVCESFALAMTRYLDALGIENSYITGLAYDYSAGGSGAHAWNYVRMNDNKWYLLDSTWNNQDGSSKSAPSTGKYLLIQGISDHSPSGPLYIENGNYYRYAALTFPTLSSSKYTPGKSGSSGSGNPGSGNSSSGSSGSGNSGSGNSGSGNSGSSSSSSGNSGSSSQGGNTTPQATGKTVAKGDTINISKDFSTASKIAKYEVKPSTLASVNNTGQLKGKKPGTVTVTARDSRGVALGVRTYTVIAPTFTKKSITIKDSGQAVDIYGYIKGAGTAKPTSVKSSDSKVVEVRNGKLYAKTSGTAKITAYFGKYKITVSVTAGLARFPKSSLTLSKKQTVTLNISKYGKGITYKTTNKKVATVSGKQTVKIKGIGAGPCDIIMMAGGEEISRCRVIVR